MMFVSEMEYGFYGYCDGGVGARYSGATNDTRVQEAGSLYGKHRGSR